MRPLPEAVARRFPGERLDPDRPEDRDRLIGGLLEEGDRADLAWLGAEADATELAAWFDRHAGRRLSRRSRAFWAAVLDRPAPPPARLAESLWPLA